MAISGFGQCGPAIVPWVNIEILRARQNDPQDDTFLMNGRFD